MDYQRNIERFYQRPDYEEITGICDGGLPGIRFKQEVYAARHTQVIPAQMADTVWKLAEKELRHPQEACLYLHIPFCNLRCTYCGFYKDKAEENVIAEYSRRLIREISLWQEQGVFRKRSVKAVFFGGGTPSVLSPSQITQILKEINNKASLADDCEVTFESSIFDMDEEKFEACLKGGVNRFSFGIQTFDTNLRRSIGRPDTQETILKKLELFAHSNARIIIDLIYGLPKQTLQQLLHDLQIALRIGVSGLDLYKLQILPGSALGKSIAGKREGYGFTTVQLANMFVRAAQFLQEKGSSRLSCCHWAMTSTEESRYNTMVKRGADIIACGCGCGGGLGPYKFMKLPGIMPYMQAIDQNRVPVMAFHKQSEAYRLLDALNGQADRGILDFKKLEMAHPIPLERLLEPVLDKWIRQGLLVKRDQLYDMTQEGAFWYRNLARVLLIMTESALFGEMTDEEKADGSKGMAMAQMKNMK